MDGVETGADAEAELAQKRQTAHVPIHGEQGTIRGEDGSTTRQERHANQCGAA